MLLAEHLLVMMGIRNGLAGDLAEGGLTMIVVTHEMGFARDAARQVVFMDRGTIVEEGAPDYIFASPAHERTRVFLRKLLR